ncbi:hypothetical protein RSAG8_02043, partial [Rhizoctonia solani AG-8 WAC10335]
MSKRKADELDAVEASDEEPQLPSEQEHGESEQDEIPDEVTPPPQPTKKKRGRPPGSKNKPKAATAGAGTSAAADATPTVKKKRGRPPKVRTPEELAAIEEKKNRPKGKRGRRVRLQPHLK